MGRRCWNLVSRGQGGCLDALQQTVWSYSKEFLNVKVDRAKLDKVCP